MNIHSTSPPAAHPAQLKRWRLAWFALAGAVVLAVHSEDRAAARSDTVPQKSTTSSQARAADEVATPSPELSPEEVVQKQLHALTAARPIAERIDRCYQFASPANREHTGPIERFSAMVQTPDYQAVLNAKHFLVGRATHQKNEAYLLVTTVDSAGELTLFRFFLSKQSKAPYANCWMTDAVIRVGTIKAPDEPHGRQRESPAI